MLTTAPDAEVASPDQTIRPHLVRDLVPLLLAVLVLAGAMWPLRRARFGIIDDHTTVAMLAGRPRLPVAAVWPVLAGHLVEPMGRFRPVYWVGQVAEATVAGADPHLWFLDRYLLAALTITGIYCACAAVVAPCWAGLISLTTVLGEQFETWSRLGVAEAYAMPLVAVGVALLVRRCKDGITVKAAAPGLWFLVVAALAKESFLLLSVAGLLVVAVVVTPRRMTRRDRISWGLLAGATACDALLVVVQLRRYGSQYDQVRSLGTVETWVGLSLGFMSHDQALPFAVVALAVLVVTGRRRGRSLAIVLTITLVLFASEVLFYAGSLGQGRYLYPGLLLAPVLWVVVLRHTHAGSTSADDHRMRSAVAVWAAVGLTFSLVPAFGHSYDRARQAADDTTAFQARLQSLERKAAADGVRTVVLQPVEPLTDQERVVSLARYLTTDADLTVMTLPPSQPSTSLSRRLGREMAGWSRSGDPTFALVPYHRPGRCLSVMFEEPQSPVCAYSTGSPG